MAEQPTGTLAVILHADVASSTELVQRDERRAHERITNAFRRFSQIIQEYGGEAHEIRGDALVAEFARGSDAVCAAIAFQHEITENNKSLDDDITPEIRIGISLGEVVIADNTVTGAGVVLAQRVEQLAEPGGICITEALRESIPSRLPLDNENLGKHEFKGFEKSVRVYAVRMQPGCRTPSAGTATSPKTNADIPRSRRGSKYSPLSYRPGLAETVGVDRGADVGRKTGTAVTGEALYRDPAIHELNWKL